MAQANDPVRRVIIGHINGIYGVQGGLKIFSFTQPRERIFTYRPWLLNINGTWGSRSLISGTGKGKTLVAYLDGITGVDQARSMLGVEIAVARDQLPELPEGEYYWCDLMDMELFDTRGVSLGRVVDMQETGANDVMVVQGVQRYLVPWVPSRVVKQIDMETGRIYVDWDTEYQ